MIFLDKLYNTAFIKYYHVSVGEKFTCVGRLLVQGHGRYKIGNEVWINSKKTANPISGGRTVLQTLNSRASIVIGNQVGISNAVLSAREKIVIEDHVMLGAGCKLFDNDFHAVSYLDRIENGDTNIGTDPIRVKEGAFIGADAMILKGVTIGRHSVIGAGAVVTKSVPDGEIWAGNPARKVGVVNDQKMEAR